MIVSPYVLNAGTTVKVEYKNHVITQDLDGKGKPEELYVTTVEVPAPDSSVHKVIVNDTYRIVYIRWNEKGEEIKTVLQTGIDQEVEKMELRDMNESDKPKNQRMADLVYIIDLDPDEEKEKDCDYERYYFPRTGPLSFGSLVKDGCYDEIPEE